MGHAAGLIAVRWKPFTDAMIRITVTRERVVCIVERIIVKYVRNGLKNSRPSCDCSDAPLMTYDIHTGRPWTSDLGLMMVEDA